MNTQEYLFPVGKGDARLELRLRHCGPEQASAPTRVALLLHGGNTHSDTFLLPHGGLAKYLMEEGYDVWLLDWRSSPWVVEALMKRGPLGGSADSERNLYTLDHVVEEDLPGALGVLRKQIGDQAELSIVGHCLGGGALALAAARGELKPFGVKNLVLSALGLFYEVPWNGWLKAEDFTIERSLQNNPDCRWIDPKDPQSWPAEFQEAYRAWPKVWLPPKGSPDETFLNRLSFMFGQPYAADAIDPSICGERLQNAFGPMHLGLYLHTGQMVRRGYVAAFNAPDVLERPRLRLGLTPSETLPGDVAPLSALPPTTDLRGEPFADFSVTLLSAAENQLWHRDSLDLMYDWLRNVQVDGKHVRCKKHVFEGYRLQELLWGRHAVDEVYPFYLSGVAGEV